MARYPALALMALGAGLALPQTGSGAEVVRRDAWTAPATVEEAAARPALNRTLAAYLSQEQAWVRIAHAGGARGSAWAQEIRGWLVALGIPGAHIQIDPGMAEAGRLRLAVQTGGERL